MRHSKLTFEWFKHSNELKIKKLISDGGRGGEGYYLELESKLLEQGAAF